jgi:hypothetical protein
MNRDTIIITAFWSIWFILYFVNLAKAIKNRMKNKPMTGKQHAKMLEQQSKQYAAFLHSSAWQKIVSCTEGLSHGDLD